MTFVYRRSLHLKLQAMNLAKQSIDLPKKKYRKRCLFAFSDPVKNSANSAAFVRREDDRVLNLVGWAWLQVSWDTTMWFRLIGH